MTSIRLSNSLLLKALTSFGIMLIAVFCMFLLAEKASAHGYIDSPGSRGYLCKLGQNTDRICQ